MDEDTGEPERPRIPDHFTPQKTRYDVYRYTSLGMSLVDTLTEMWHNGDLDPDSKDNSDNMANDAIKVFDEICNDELKKLTNEVQLSGDLRMYRNCEGLWTFQMAQSDITVKKAPLLIKLEDCMLTAVDIRAAADEAASRRTQTTNSQLATAVVGLSEQAAPSGLAAQEPEDQEESDVDDFA
jgi:hypothetical protein